MNNFSSGQYCLLLAPQTTLLKKDHNTQAYKIDIFFPHMEHYDFLLGKGTSTAAPPNPTSHADTLERGGAEGQNGWHFAGFLAQVCVYFPACG